MPKRNRASTSTYLPVARGFLYRSLSVGFMYPTLKMFDLFQNGHYITDLWDKLSLIAYLGDFVSTREESAQRVSRDLKELSCDDLEARYAEVFCTEFAESSLSLHEGRQQELDGTSIHTKLSEVYERFGLTMADETGRRERVDHLSVELEFLHYLTLKEFQSASRHDGEGLMASLMAQRNFLEHHLLKWVPGFGARLEGSVGLPLYPELARITSEFIRKDYVWIAARFEDSQGRMAGRKVLCTI